MTNRERDARIAKALGWDVVALDSVPHYTTDDVAALSLVMWLRNRGYVVELRLWHDDHLNWSDRRLPFGCMVSQAHPNPAGSPERCGMADSDTLADAICQAVEQALGVHNA